MQKRRALTSTCTRYMYACNDSAIRWLLEALQATFCSCWVAPWRSAAGVAGASCTALNAEPLLAKWPGRTPPDFALVGPAWQHHRQPPQRHQYGPLRP